MMHNIYNIYIYNTLYIYIITLYIYILYYIGRITKRADMPRSLQPPNWVPPSMGMRCTEAEQAVREIGASFSKVQVISMVILLSTDVHTDTSNSFLQNQ